MNLFFLFVTNIMYQPGAKTQNWWVWGVSNMAVRLTEILCIMWALPGRMHFAFPSMPATTFLFPLEILRPLEVLDSPWRGLKSGVRESTSPTVLVRPQGEENPLLAPCGACSPAFPISLQEETPWYSSGASALVISFGCSLRCLNANVGTHIMVYMLPRSVLFTWKSVDVNFWKGQPSASLVLSYIIRSPGCYRCSTKITTSMPL